MEMLRNVKRRIGMSERELRSLWDTPLLCQEIFFFILVNFLKRCVISVYSVGYGIHNQSPASGSKGKTSRFHK
jgi:hypothetical protein